MGIGHGWMGWTRMGDGEDFLIFDFLISRLGEGDGDF